MNKKVIRLTESDLHKIVKESVNKILNESGETNRGKYMLGRLLNRNYTQNYDNDQLRATTTRRDVYDRIDPTDDTAFQDGYNDQKNGKDPYHIKFKYDAYKMKDMDNLGRKFIDFIEKHEGGALLQTIVDFETGNETGTPTSPLPTIIPEFEDAVVGHKCTPEMRKAIKAAYNQWWFYAQDQLIPDQY